MVENTKIQDDESVKVKDIMTDGHESVKAADKDFAAAEIAVRNAEQAVKDAAESKAANNTTAARKKLRVAREELIAAKDHVVQMKLVAQCLSKNVTGISRRFKDICLH